LSRSCLIVRHSFSARCTRLFNSSTVSCNRCERVSVFVDILICCDESLFETALRFKFSTSFFNNSTVDSNSNFANDSSSKRNCISSKRRHISSSASLAIRAFSACNVIKRSSSSSACNATRENSPRSKSRSLTAPVPATTAAVIDLDPGDAPVLLPLVVGDKRDVEPSFDPGPFRLLCVSFGLFNALNGAGEILCKGANKPYFILHSKYRLPATEPSFLPKGSSNSIPAHCPAEKSVSPKKRNVPSFVPELALTNTRSPIPSPLWQSGIGAFVNLCGFTNTPQLFGQLKYLIPDTEPSFLPSGDVNCTPIHLPLANFVSPINLIIPGR
ncbi:hypothetical protein DERP_000900, partial [Dermatophagoides pteronyssinus]